MHKIKMFDGWSADTIRDKKTCPHDGQICHPKKADVECVRCYEKYVNSYLPIIAEEGR